MDHILTTCVQQAPNKSQDISLQKRGYSVSPSESLSLIMVQLCRLLYAFASAFVAVPVTEGKERHSNLGRVSSVSSLNIPIRERQFLYSDHAVTYHNSSLH